MTHRYDLKLNVEMLRQCQGCLKMGNGRVQHHIDGRRYSEECIWLCVSCHREVHLNPRWAIENGLMRKHNTNTYHKKSRARRCSHAKRYWSQPEQKFICQLCKARLTESTLNFREITHD